LLFRLVAAGYERRSLAVASHWLLSLCRSASMRSAISSKTGGRMSAIPFACGSSSFGVMPFAPGHR
jgi:hypothetical protein